MAVWETSGGHGNLFQPAFLCLQFVLTQADYDPIFQNGTYLRIAYCGTPILRPH